MPCVSLKHLYSYRASLKQAKILASQQVLEQKTIEKAVEITQKMEDVVPIAVIVEKRVVEPKESTSAGATEKVATSSATIEKTTTGNTTAEKATSGVAVEQTTVEKKTSKIKALTERRKAKQAAREVTRRAAKAERAAVRDSKRVARDSEKAARKSEKVARSSEIEAKKKERAVQKAAAAKAKAESRAARKVAAAKAKAASKAAREAEAKAVKAPAQTAEIPVDKAAVETAIEAKARVAKMAEQSFKVPHSRVQASETAAQGVAGAEVTAQAASGAVANVTAGATMATATAEKLVAGKVATEKAAKVPKPAKITPRTNIPGMISTASLKKSTTVAVRPMPSSVFMRRNGKLTRADLINAESRLGSQLFGTVPEGHRREFFHDKKNIWIWHEDWVDEMEHERQMTIRYEVRTSGVYKKIAAGKYFKLEGEELENFRKATHAYLYVIKKYLYNHPYSNVRGAV